jgi:hypothetical protein
MNENVKYELTCTCGYDTDEYANTLIEKGYQIYKTIKQVRSECWYDNDTGKWVPFEHFSDKIFYYVCLHDLVELNDIADITGHPVIVSLNSDGEPTLEIYDDYRE